MTAADVHGDAELAERLRGRLGRRHPVAAVGTVSPGATSTAVYGASLESGFEIGSISKGITGLLYVDALERGELRPASTLGEHLPLGECEAASVTLESVSRHRSGLPGLPRSAEPLKRTVSLMLRGENPYGESLAQLLVQARGVKLSKPRPRYSNFGFELLGHAIAAGPGLTYQELVRQRIAEPLGLTSLYAPASPEQLRPDALIGTSRFGRSRQPWTGEAVAPAGGIRASIVDMTRFTAALLDGSAPGLRALEPVATLRGVVRIGAAWITLEVKGRTVTWHNGGTGGFRTWMGIDRAAGTGVVVMSATSASVDRHGFDLLESLNV